jgi:hypothetical protein
VAAGPARAQRPAATTTATPTNPEQGGGPSSGPVVQGSGPSVGWPRTTTGPLRGARVPTSRPGRHSPTGRSACPPPIGVTAADRRGHDRCATARSVWLTATRVEPSTVMSTERMARRSIAHRDPQAVRPAGFEGFGAPSVASAECRRLPATGARRAGT